MMMKINDFVTV